MGAIFVLPVHELQQQLLCHGSATPICTDSALLSLYRGVQGELKLTSPPSKPCLLLKGGGCSSCVMVVDSCLTP